MQGSLVDQPPSGALGTQDPLAPDSSPLLPDHPDDASLIPTRAEPGNRGPWDLNL